MTCHFFTTQQCTQNLSNSILHTAESQGQIIATGSVCLLNGEGRGLWIHHVQCVPTASSNLLSVSAAIRDGCRLVTQEEGAYVEMLGPDDWVCRVREVHGLYVLRNVHPTTLPVVCQVCMRHSANLADKVHKRHDCGLRKLWHERLGHPGITAMERLQREELCTGIPISLIQCQRCDTHCDPCVRGKQCKPAFPTSTREPARVMHRVHADTVGQLPHPGTGGERYFVTAVEEYSNYCEVLPV